MSTPRLELGTEHRALKGEAGMGEATMAALWRFQADNDLAATGFPDAETIRRLGLKPDDVYLSPPKRAEAAEHLRENPRQ